MKIRIKRVYEPPTPEDGRRILVDRLWPRGFSKEKAKIDYWARGIAPSTELRKWYGHEAMKWLEFQARYAAELEANPAGLEDLRNQLGDEVTLVFSSKELHLNNAAALKIYLERG
jgi:uncharacterized protein YeaO (DUF488 family)